MKPLIVIDTNVYVSALMYADSPASLAVVQAFRYFQPIASHATWDELQAVSSREKFKRFYSGSERLYFLVQVAQSTIMHTVDMVVNDCRDAADNLFLALALTANCGVILSGDSDLTEMDPYRGVRILSPRLFITALEDSTRG